MTDKLKPCPFCGGQAHFVNDKENWISCMECGAESDFCDDKSQAIIAWNTREPMDRIVEQLEGERKSILGKYDNNTPVLDKPVCKIAFNNGIDKAIDIVKGVQNE